MTSFARKSQRDKLKKMFKKLRKEDSNLKNVTFSQFQAFYKLSKQSDVRHSLTEEEALAVDDLLIDDSLEEETDVKEDSASE